MILRFSSSRPIYSSSTHGRGFTLIETLISITLLALVLGLVVPMGIQSFERAQAKSEVLLLQRYLVLARERAYSMGKPLAVGFEGKSVNIIPLRDSQSGGTTLYLRPLLLDELFFESQEIEFNELGFVSTNQLIYRHKDQEHVIDLRFFLNNQA